MSDTSRRSYPEVIEPRGGGSSTISEPCTPRRIVSLNIRHGGGKQIGKLTARLLAYDADVLVITEFQIRKGSRLTQALKAEGYNTTHPPNADPKRNTVLIASRHGIDREWAFDPELDTHHLWCAEIAGMNICATYLPVNTELRMPHLESLIANANATGLDLIMGDFNTGTNNLDKSPTGSPFPRAEMLDQLIAAGYADLWRDAHPETREYSYYSFREGRPYNGFRVDYALAAPSLAGHVATCEFDHTPRTLNETDHSALLIVLA